MVTNFYQSAAVFLESCRDLAIALEDPPLTDIVKKVTVHETGHQFELAAGVPAENQHHRDDPMNVMHSQAATEAVDSEFFFHPRDVLGLRRRFKSPNLTHDNGL
jgi:hypothetical protein